jgi:DNA-binding Lrp family transcriptional regulator
LARIVVSLQVRSGEIYEIWSTTERGIIYRLRKLENDNVILWCSAILNPNLVSERLNRTITLRFKYSNKLSTLIERLKNYVQEALFCVYSARVSGGDFDCISHFVFQSLEQYELESNNFLNRFAADSGLSLI